MVIFGASGDLAQRKLVPALHNLCAEGSMSGRSAVVGTARTAYSDEEFARQMHEAVREHSRRDPSSGPTEGFFRNVHYVAGDLDDPESYKRLGKRLEELDDEQGTRGNRIWYLALLPHLFAGAAEGIAKAGLLDTSGWHRLVVEKPFGLNLDSARELSGHLQQWFGEDQIFRIDHYLGKETVQNLLVFRFANAIFEPLWNRRHVDSVQISVAEDIGIEGRAAFYERVGALRDVGQNHLLQLLSLITMEPPIAWEPDAIRDEKVKILRAVRRWTLRDCDQVVVRGQYDGYLDEEDVDPQSTTETFVAFKLLVDNWRWADVPFYLRTGKRLPTQKSEITIRFKNVPHLLFRRTEVEELEANSLVIRIQPNEGFDLRFGAKVPGPAVNVRSVDMDFYYESEFGSGTPEAYERLLLDAMNGDATLFTRDDEILEAWEIVDPLLGYWEQDGRPARYEPGTWGPDAAEDLPRADGRRWRDHP